VRRLLAAGTALVISGVLPGFLTASLVTRISRDFPFGAKELGLAVALFYAVSAVGSTPAGRFVDAVGPARGMIVCAGLTVVASLTIALFARSALALAALLVVAGVGNALSGPVVGARFRAELPRDRHGLAFGLFQAGGPLGALLAGLALPALAVPFGWRWAYAATALIACAAALGGGSRAPAPSRARPAPRPVSIPIERKQVWKLAGVSALANAAAMSVVAFFVVYATERHMSEGAAGFVLAAISLGAAIARIAVGGVADAGRRHPLRLVAMLLAGSTVGYALLMIGSPASIAAGGLVVAVLGWSWAGALTLAVAGFSASAPAWGVGVMMTGLFTGAMVGPFAVGLLVEARSFAAAWLLCAVLAAAAAATAELTRIR
jgi:predicted MFS family arabinose efflux permease